MRSFQARFDIMKCPANNNNNNNNNNNDDDDYKNYEFIPLSVCLHVEKNITIIIIIQGLYGNPGKSWISDLIESSPGNPER